MKKLQTLQNELAELQNTTSTTEEGTGEILKQRAHTQSLLDEEFREQLRDLWEHVLAHTPAQDQMMREQKITVEHNTNEIRALWLQGRQMRENIEAIHNLIGKLNTGSALRTPLANEFDI